MTLQISPDVDNLDLSNTVEMKKITSEMKKDLEQIIDHMNLVVNTSLDKKLQTNTFKSKISDLADLINKAKENSDLAEFNRVDSRNIVTNAETDVLKVKNAMNNIAELVTDLSQSDRDKITSVLEDSFVEKTHGVEKAVIKLHSVEKAQNISDKKTGELKESLVAIESSYAKQVERSDFFSSNAEKTLLHIVQTYAKVLHTADNMLHILTDVSNVSDSDLEKPDSTVQKQRVIFEESSDNSLSEMT